MAAKIFQNGHEISKQEIQTAIAEAVELRALHAALLHGNSPANLTFTGSASPSLQRSSNQFSAKEYPVFTPGTIKFNPRIKGYLKFVMVLGHKQKEKMMQQNSTIK